MKYCSECGSEYRDDIQRCADCDNVELISAEEMRKRGIPLAGELDTRRFERAGTADDPLSTEEITSYLRARQITVFARQRMGGTVDRVTDGTLPYWEILVPEEQVDQARDLIDEAKAVLSSTEDEAARAAEEEEAELEQAGAKPA